MQYKVRCFLSVCPRIPPVVFRLFAQAGGTGGPKFRNGMEMLDWKSVPPNIAEDFQAKRVALAPMPTRTRTYARARARAHARTRVSACYARMYACMRIHIRTHMRDGVRMRDGCTACECATGFACTPSRIRMLPSHVHTPWRVQEPSACTSCRACACHRACMCCRACTRLGTCGWHARMARADGTCG